MIKRISIISTAVLAVLLVAGLAWATPDDSTSSTSTSTTLAQSAASRSLAAIGSETYDAGAAGQVTVDQAGASLSVGNIAANSGWGAEVEVATGREVEVKFVNGTDRIDFQAELEDGLVKTRVRVRALDGSIDDNSTDDSSDDSSDDSVNDSDSDDSDDSNDHSSDDSDDGSDDSDDDSSGRSHDDDDDGDDKDTSLDD